MHTPGPWNCGNLRVNGADPQFDGCDIGADNGSNIAIVFHETKDREIKETKANARLIAAAPDLHAYAKCEEARSFGEDVAETVLKQYGWNPSVCTSHEFMDKMRRAALAKVDARNTDLRGSTQYDA